MSTRKENCSLPRITCSPHAHEGGGCGRWARAQPLCPFDKGHVAVVERTLVPLKKTSTELTAATAGALLLSAVNDEQRREAKYEQHEEQVDGVGGRGQISDGNLHHATLATHAGAWAGGNQSQCVCGGGRGANVTVCATVHGSCTYLVGSLCDSREHLARICVGRAHARLAHHSGHPLAQGKD
eukprot:5691116-Prymnesium_polylepis.1